MALLANEARFFRFRVFFGERSLQNEVSDPQFFRLFGKSRSLPFCMASLKIICAWELLGANVLRAIMITNLHQNPGRNMSIKVDHRKRSR